MRAWVPVVIGIGLAAVSARAEQTIPEPLREVGIDQRLNEMLPLDLAFRDESGKAVRMKDYFDGKPVILNLVYYRCPMLCTEVLNGQVNAMRAMPFSAGREFVVVTVSVDPAESPELAAAKKTEYLRRYGREGADRGWHFLTGDAASIRELARAVGFRYRPLPEKNQFAHAAAIMIVTPEGKLARYFFGIEYPPRDLRLALVEASAGRIGARLDQVMLFCFQYNPATAKYGFAVLRALRWGGAATAVGLAGFVLYLVRRDRRKAVG